MKSLKLLQEVEALLNDRNTLLEMSFSKDVFKLHMFGALKGAFKEFMCDEIAVRIGTPFRWTPEVKRLAKVIDDLIHTAKLKAKGKNAKKNCVMESICEFSPYIYVNAARNKLIGPAYYPSRAQEIESLDIDADAEFKKFVREYLPAEYHNFKPFNEK
jgi:hypothetical protein